MRQRGFHRIEKRLPYAGRQPDGRAFHNAAHRIACGFRLGHRKLHSLRFPSIDQRQRLGFPSFKLRFCQVLRCHLCIRHIVDALDMRPHINALLRQHLLADSAAKYQRRRDAPGKMPAASVIVVSSIAHSARIICMAGTHRVVEVRIIPLRVFVFSITAQSGVPVV